MKKHAAALQMLRKTISSILLYTKLNPMNREKQGVCNSMQRGLFDG